MPQSISRTPSATTIPSGSPNLGNTRFQNDPQLSGVLAGGTLASGAKGEGVKKLQQAFSDMGFAVQAPPDGAFGPQMQKSVRNFQVNAAKMFPQVRPTGILDAATLKALDALAPAAGQKGQTKNIPAPLYDGKPVRVVVLKDEHRTFLFDKAGKLQNIYINAVGKAATQTDGGLKVVTGKLNEAACNAAGERLWGGRVFGPRMIDLSWVDGKHSGEELHGSNAPQQLGEDVSHGCVRHDNKDILAMYDILNVGDQVAIATGLNDPRLNGPASSWVR